MIVDLIIHVMFQVVLATIMFWLIIIPTCKATVKAHVDEIIDKSVDESLLKPKERMLIDKMVKKEVLFEILSKNDQYAFEKNTRVLMVNVGILIAFLTIGFISLIYFSCRINIFPILVELGVTYSIVFVAQMLFVKYVVTKYYPTTQTDMLRFISSSIEKTCKQES